MSKRVADLLVETPEAAGVMTCYGIVGNTINRIAHAMQLVTPPSAFVSREGVVGMTVYTARAMLQGKDHDVWEMVVDNIR
jgi:thiamine pyrophosphate-dependent acetolactate synthase large subunit-like protein